MTFNAYADAARTDVERQIEAIHVEIASLRRVQNTAFDNNDFDRVEDIARQICANYLRIETLLADA